jgi:8-oxo-dGTP diphosphatase
VTEPFHGAKIALLVEDQIVTILRDDIPTIPWPDHWDLPGGGREGNETPVECALRELHEELGLTLDPASVNWLMRDTSPLGFRWFLVAELPRFDTSMVNFGNEGQEWRLVELDWYLSHEKAISNHKERLRTYLRHRPGKLFKGTENHGNL